MTNKKNILFVEDDAVDRMALERTLKENKNFNAITAKNLNHAIEILKDETCEVIIADIDLGDGCGIDLITKYPDIPVIIVTGSQDIEFAIQALRAGAYDFLVKDMDRTYIKMVTIACQQAIMRKTQELHLLQLTQAVEQNPSLILITDMNGKIEYANPKFQEITGYSDIELIGKTSKIFYSGQHDKEFYENLWNTITAGKKWTGEIYNKTKNDTFYWEFASIAPLCNSAGKITHFIKVGEDISAMKKAEAERLEKNRLQSILEIAGTISHEFNQPLQIILGYSELLKEKINSDDPTTVKQFESIVKNIHRMLETSEKLKNITKYKTLPYLDKWGIVDIHGEG